jgi:hypothetical protein
MSRFDCILEIDGTSGTSGTSGTYKQFNKSEKNINPFMNKFIPENKNENTFKNNDKPCRFDVLKPTETNIFKDKDFKDKDFKDKDFKDKDFKDKDFNDSGNIFLNKRRYIETEEKQIKQEKIDVKSKELFPSLPTKNIKKKNIVKVKENNYKEKIYECINKPPPEPEEETYDPTTDPYYISKDLKQDVDISIFKINKKKKIYDNLSDEIDNLCMDNMKETMNDNDFSDWCDYLDEEHPETLKKYTNHLNKKKKLLSHI